MGYTKRQLIEDAFDEIGLPAYVFELQPEQYQSALRRLDTMMAEWDLKGIRLGYPIGAPGSSDISQDTGIPLGAASAVILNLALRIASGVGKTPSADTKSNARTAFNAVLNVAAMPNEYQWPSTLPRGAGNKPWRWYQTFFQPPTDQDMPAPAVDMTFTKGT